MDEVEEELQDWEMLETTSIYSSPPTIIQVGDSQSLIQSDYFNIHRVPSAESVTKEDNNEMGGGDSSKHELGCEERDHGSVLEEVRGFGEVGSEVCSETSEIQVVEEETSRNPRADAQEMENLGAETVTGGYEQTRDGDEVEDRSGDVIQGGDVARSVTVWWKVPVELLKFCVFRVSPVWTFSIAAAVMGLILLKRRLSRMRRKSRSIPIKLTVEDKGQRSGKLPPDQEITWRSNSGLSDGSAAKVDLRGGYYDAGDNVKFNFPMAFATTMLSWSTLEYGGRMGSQLGSARAAIRWATDYLLKCATATPGKLYVGVGDPNVDHKCWERPEDMSTVRTVYSVSARNPGSDVAGETAAALAAASMVFRKVDPAYSKVLLNTAKTVMQFALQYRGSYSDSLQSSVCPFYCSYSGYKDELVWGAAWLLTATRDRSYYNILNSLGGIDGTDIFSWDNKFAGASVLLSRQTVVSNNKDFEQHRQEAENFMCRIIPNSPSSSTEYTKGGLIYKLSGSNLQYVTSITFLLNTYAKYMMSARHTFRCGNLLVAPSTLRNLAKRQVDYILGENPLRMSYMVGYGPDFPRRIHHRGSSLPSVLKHPQTIGCDGGFQPFFYSANPNPNILTGAVVGGPDQNDFYRDDRTDYSHSEPATYINAALVGSLAYLAGSYNS